MKDQEICEAYSIPLRSNRANLLLRKGITALLTLNYWPYSKRSGSKDPI
jgi:hypothetical protein